MVGAQALWAFPLLVGTATHCAVLGCGNVIRVHAPGPHSDLSFRVGPLELILRCILAFLVGVTLHIEYFYRFLPYGRREQQLPGFWIFRGCNVPRRICVKFPDTDPTTSACNSPDD